MMHEFLVIVCLLNQTGYLSIVATLTGLLTLWFFIKQVDISKRQLIMMNREKIHFFYEKINHFIRMAINEKDYSTPRKRSEFNRELESMELYLDKKILNNVSSMLDVVSKMYKINKDREKFNLADVEREKLNKDEKDLLVKLKEHQDKSTKLFKALFPVE